MPDTPLGYIVSIRAEKDNEVIKKFTKDQKRIRNEWLKRKNQERNKNGLNATYWTNFQKWAQDCFS